METLSRPRFLEISEKCLSQHDDHQLTTTPAPVTDNQYNKCVLPEVIIEIDQFLVNFIMSYDECRSWTIGL